MFDEEYLAGCGVVDRPDDATGLHLVVRQRLADVEDGADREPALLGQVLCPLVGRPTLELGGEFGLEFVQVFDAVPVGREAVVARQVRALERVTEDLPEALVPSSSTSTTLSSLQRRWADPSVADVHYLRTPALIYVTSEGNASSVRSVVDEQLQGVPAEDAPRVGTGGDVLDAVDELVEDRGDPGLVWEVRPEQDVFRGELLEGRP